GGSAAGAGRAGWLAGPPGWPSVAGWEASHFRARAAQANCSSCAGVEFNQARSASTISLASAGGERSSRSGTASASSTRAVASSATASSESSRPRISSGVKGAPESVARPEDVIPERARDAEAPVQVPTVEVVAHVMPRQLAQQAHLRSAVVHVIVREVVDDVARHEPRVHCPALVLEDPRPQAEEEEEERDADGRGHHQPKPVVRPLVVNAVDQEM